MVFSSLLFLFRFLPIVLLGYFCVPRKFRNLFLLIVSLFFYAWGEPTYILLMLASIVINYFGGIAVNRFRGSKWSRLALVLVIVIALLLLGVFKYAGFFAENLNALLKTDIVLSIVLPIGISFYTFQMLSYVIDVYRGNAEVQKNIISFGCYVSLFPQLIAGPIVQYKTVATQLSERRESFDLFGEGVKRFMAGLSKKVLIANNVGALWDIVSSSDLSSLPAFTAWLGILAFTFQIYFDFSGYSDMAIGLGKMFGFEFLENFNYPYISRSITEFWRRWHVSLGTWFKEYLYIPLGGNRKGFLKQIRNIAIVWLMTGIWHGASWNFALWGIYFGIILIIEKLFLLKVLSKVHPIISHLYSALLFVYGWVIFALEDVSSIALYTKALFGANGLYNGESFYLFLNYALLLVIALVFSTPFPKRLYDRVCEIRPRTALAMTSLAIVLVFFLSVVYVTASTYNPFLYFRF